MVDTVDIPQDEQQEVLIPAQGLQDLLVKMFVRMGMFAAEAEIGAKRLVEADLRGIHSHGSRAVSRYLEAMDMGDIDSRAQILTLKETPAIAVIDGSKGLGHVAATRAMELAIAKAKEVGTGTVAVRRGQHFGAASVYAMMAAEAGMLGFCTTSTGPATVAAFGSTQPGTANNALAWSVPVREGAPFVLDMACAETSWGKIDSLKQYGLAIPEGWALDAEGNPTTDPAAIKTLLPTAGARGYGLAFLCSALAGPLVGARMPIHKGWAVESQGSEHFFQAINPAMFGELDEFYNEVESAMADIRQLTPAPGFDKVRLPGELEWERAQKWKEIGIPLHKTHVATLEKYARKWKFDIPWEPVSD